MIVEAPDVGGGRIRHCRRLRNRFSIVDFRYLPHVHAIVHAFPALPEIGGRFGHGNAVETVGVDVGVDIDFGGRVGRLKSGEGTPGSLDPRLLRTPGRRSRHEPRIGPAPLADRHVAYQPPLLPAPGKLL